MATQLLSSPIAGDFCGTGTSAKEYNKNTWQNQYCYKTVTSVSNKADVTAYSFGACPGGKWAILNAPVSSTTSNNVTTTIVGHKGSDAAYKRCESGNTGGTISSCTEADYATCADVAAKCTPITGAGLCSTMGCFDWVSNACETTDKFDCREYGTAHNVTTEWGNGTSPGGECFATSVNNGTACAALPGNAAASWISVGTCSATHGDYPEVEECPAYDAADVAAGKLSFAATEGQCLWSNLASGTCSGFGGTPEPFGACRYDGPAAPGKLSIAGSTATCEDIGLADGVLEGISKGTCTWTGVTNAQCSGVSGSWNTTAATSTCTETTPNVLASACTGSGYTWNSATATSTCTKTTTEDHTTGANSAICDSYVPTEGTCAWTSDPDEDCDGNSDPGNGGISCSAQLSYEACDALGGSGVNDEGTCTKVTGSNVLEVACTGTGGAWDASTATSTCQRVHTTTSATCSGGTWDATNATSTCTDADNAAYINAATCATALASGTPSWVPTEAVCFWDGIPEDDCEGWTSGGTPVAPGDVAGNGTATGWEETTSGCVYDIDTGASEPVTQATCNSKAAGGGLEVTKGKCSYTGKTQAFCSLLTGFNNDYSATDQKCKVTDPSDY